MEHKSRFGVNQLPGWFIVAIIPVIFLVVFYILPVYEIFHKSLSGIVLQESSSQIWSIVSKSLGFTVWQALLSTFLTLLLGLPAAYVLYKVQFRGRSIIRTITAIPFILPTVVVAAGINAFIGPRGWINLVLQGFLNLSTPPIHIMGTLSAILIAHVFYNLTIVIRLVGSAWSSLNPSLEAAANTLGANPFRTFWYITLPLLKPVIAAAIILVFLFDFTSFGVILLLGGPGFATLEVEVFTQAMALFNLPLASILAFIQLICTLILTLVYQYFSSRPIPLVPAAEKANSTRPPKEQVKRYLLRRLLLSYCFLYSLLWFPWSQDPLSGWMLIEESVLAYRVVLPWIITRHYQLIPARIISIFPRFLRSGIR